MLQKCRCVITTSNNPSREAVIQAKTLSQSLGIPYLNRRHVGEKLRNGLIEFFYVVDNNLQLSISVGGQRLFFHPGIAKIRMENFRRDGRDYLLEALKPESNDVVYDATFGLGMDAIFIAHFVSKVVGTEVSEHIYNVVSYGLKHYVAKKDWINTAIQKIELYNDDMRTFVSRQSNKSFDIVYCDPMFENPKYESSALNPLRPLASYDTVDDQLISEFVRIARKRVVIKTLEKDSLLDRLKTPFHRIIKSPRSGLVFACIELADKGC